MSPAEIAAHVLNVDATAIATAERIKHGLTNESWLVRTAADSVVVRVSSRHWASLQIDRAAEAQILSAVAKARIGPEILACDLSRGVLVTRYLGPTCTQAQMTEAGLIERLGTLFRALHAVPAPTQARAIHLPAVIAGYVDTLGTLNRESPHAEGDTLKRAMKLANDVAETSSPRLCHNDVHHLNLIDSGTLRLIDWEYAGLGEPYFDLASVCVYHEYTLQQRLGLLAAYHGGETGAATERLAKCCWLFEYVRDLWTVVRAAVETG